MTQHDTSLKLTRLIQLDPDNTLTYVKWAFAVGYDLGRDRNNPSKPVLQLSLDGEFIEVHDSMGQAAEITDVWISSISRAANGKLSQAGGYKWRLLDD
jgi:hypothetical protein